MSGENETTVIGGPPYMSQHPIAAGIYLTIAGSASVVGTLGNLGVLGAIACNKQLHHARNVFIANLAIADVCVTSFADPFSVVGMAAGKIYFDQRPILCDIVATVCTMACIAAFFSIGGIAFNRYIHICHPDFYSRIFSFRVNISLCSGFWLLGILLSLPALLGWTDNIYDHKYLECVWSRTHSFSWTVFFSVCVVATPVCIISFSFLKIFLHVRASKRRIEPEKGTGSTIQGGHKNRNSSIKLARTLFIIFAVFVGCWSPFALLVVIDFRDEGSMELHLFILLLAHMHSTLNSLVYAVTNAHFRSGYGKLLTRLTCGKIQMASESSMEEAKTKGTTTPVVTSIRIGT